MKAKTPLQNTKFVGDLKIGGVIIDLPLMSWTKLAKFL